MFALTVIYGVLRILMSLTQQGRDALFAAVAMNAVRRLAIEVFVHLHQLSLRFHLERKTGGLTRVLERGRAAIETIIRTSMLTAAPTAFEFVLIVGAFLFTFDWRYVAVLVVTVALYLVYTTLATNWRISIRRSMNESDTDANTKAIDSLLNFETVKYFGAEEREAARYEKSMARYERMSVRTYVSLAVLNAGQAVIFTFGMVAVLLMCVAGVRSGRNTVGDFALLNVMMLQLYQPLNFMGMVYREIKQAIIDIGAMFDILGQNPGDQGRSRRARSRRFERRRRIRGRRLRLRCAAADLEGRLVRGAGGPHDRDRRAVGGRQIDDLAAAVSLLRARPGPHHDRRAGHRQGHADLAARGDRHGAAGYGAVQRHRRLQCALRPRRRDRRGSARGGRARAHRRLHPLAADGLRLASRRARPEDCPAARSSASPSPARS